MKIEKDIKNGTLVTPVLQKCSH